MNKNYIIRKARPKDAKRIHKILLAAFKEFRKYYTNEGFNDTVMSEEAVLVRMKEMTIYVAVNKDNNLIGTIGWQKIGYEEGHVRGMAVHPNW